MQQHGGNEKCNVKHECRELFWLMLLCCIEERKRRKSEVVSVSEVNMRHGLWLPFGLFLKAGGGANI